MSDFVAVLAEVRLVVVGVLAVVLAVTASAHAILYKRDSRAAVGWVGLILFAPIAGAVLYAVFGINRIRRGASLLRSVEMRHTGSMAVPRPSAEQVAALLPDLDDHLAKQATLVDRVTRRNITTGNTITPLVNGDEAFPAMLQAVDRAERSVALSTYIFDNDEVGRAFARALGRAVGRGVTVRVLVDGVGARYTWPPIIRTLRKHGVRVARFMPTVLPWRAPFWNLRNHRKILVVDGRAGFTGGINIRRGSVIGASPKRPVQDLHFEVQGPVVRQLLEAFAEDWVFTTREVLDGPDWFTDLPQVGRTAARGITDGPDEDFEKLRWSILGAIATARRTVHVITPYFLPDATMVAALNVAALRGVDIRIVLPEKNNQPLVHWATRAMLWQLVKRDCRVYYSPPPFDHSKLLVVDGAWTLIGSANWDPRSLRLNFEFNVECYDTEFGDRMDAFFACKQGASRLITAEELDNRSLPARLRDGVVRLAAPYL